MNRGQNITINKLQKKSILVVFQPWRTFQDSLHSQLIEGLKNLDFEVSYLDIENPPIFKNNHFGDKIKNIFERIFRKNKSYILIAENKHYNRFYYTKLIEHKKLNQKYDFILIIKPEEYSEKFIKEVSKMGEKTVGYIWDGLRLFFKSQLAKNRKYLNALYSFDKNNIKDHPELNMKFLTNYYISNDTPLPFEEREIDYFYIGDLAGTLPSQRRDWKLSKLINHLHGNLDIKIYTTPSFLEKDKNLKDNITYTTKFSSVKDTLIKTKKSKIVIDICKNHHIGLSFRFFECMLYETKIITNNTDIINYDFYHPHNILVVDFDNIDAYIEKINSFENIPYHKIDDKIKQKYSLENWISYIFNIKSDK